MKRNSSAGKIGGDGSPQFSDGRTTHNPPDRLGAGEWGEIVHCIRYSRGPYILARSAPFQTPRSRREVPVGSRATRKLAVVGVDIRHTAGNGGHGRQGLAETWLPWRDLGSQEVEMDNSTRPQDHRVSGRAGSDAHPAELPCPTGSWVWASAASGRRWTWIHVLRRKKNLMTT